MNHFFNYIKLRSQTVGRDEEDKNAVILHLLVLQVTSRVYKGSECVCSTSIFPVIFTYIRPLVLWNVLKIVYGKRFSSYIGLCVSSSGPGASSNLHTCGCLRFEVWQTPVCEDSNQIIFKIG